MDDRAFTKLEAFLRKVPGIVGTIGKGADKQGQW